MTSHELQPTPPSPVVLTHVEGEARVDSRLIARRLAVQHENVLGLLSDYEGDFSALGFLRFETGEIVGRGRPPRFALLSEDQAYFLLTLVRNTSQAVALKRGLVEAFRTTRELAAQKASPLALSRALLEALEQQEGRVAAIEHRLNTAPIRTNSGLRAQVYAAGQRFGRVHPKGYGGAWRTFKEAFGESGVPLAAYDDLPCHRVAEALAWLDAQTRTYTAQRPLLGEGGSGAQA